MNTPTTHVKSILHRLMVLTACFCLALGVGQTSTAEPSAAFKPENPRCEFLINPAGIDVAKPRLMWTLAAADPKARDLRETACQILVASTPEKLARDEGDLWDSSKTTRGDVPMIDYAGKPLTSRQICYWKVRVWDQNDNSSEWSAPALWTMGLLDRADWQAQWISDPADVASREKLEPHWGYHSVIGTAGDEEKWVQVDLGKPFPIDSIRLYPAHAPWVSPYLALYFPQRFRIEASNHADFSDPTVLVDRAAADEPLPETQVRIYQAKPCVARYVRLTATKLSSYNGKEFALALGEMEVLDSERNRALGCEVTAKDSLAPEPGWSLAKLTDGNRQMDPGGNRLKPAAYFRKDFQVELQARRALVFSTALGTYELRINGQRVGDALLAPEFTRWVDRVQYQAYDVTSLLRPGENTIAAVLAEGWYAGRFWPKSAQAPEDYPRLLVQLDIEKEDGSLQQICSDGSWRSTNDGPIRSADLYDGEVYDATREINGWDAPGFADAGWAAVRAEPLAAQPILSRQPNEPIRVMKEFQPVAITEPEPGVYVADFGQNLVGWCRAVFDEDAGSVISLRHAELLDSAGMLDTNSLDHAFANDSYTCRGQGRETFEPHFTYHGFRYLELRGLSKPPKPEDFTACALHSGVPTAGRFESSNELLNRIMHAAEWTQRGNLTGVATDCPQRSERNGWMGDFQTASQAFLFHLDLSAFLSKWIRDIRDSQADDGRFSEFAPSVLDPNVLHSGTAAWADGGVIIPWRAYVNYADRRMLAEHYEAARRWVDYIAERNPDRVWENELGNRFGDWLNQEVASGTGGSTPIEVFSTCFWAHTSGLVAQMAAVLGKTDDAQKYAQLSEEIKAAFQKRYLQPDGTLLGNSQSVYAMALHFGLLTPEQQEQALANLLAAIKKNNGRITCGMQSAHRMLLELSARGSHEEAFRMVMAREFPSYGYMMDQGATTIWESWETDRIGNSWNHPAFSAVAEWAWRTLAGINPQETAPGYKHFVLRPMPAGDLQWVKASYESPYGTIHSAWKRDGGRFTLEVTVPPGSTAEVVVPAAAGAVLTETGKPVQATRTEPGRAVFAIGSGDYVFESQLSQQNDK